MTKPLVLAGLCALVFAMVAVAPAQAGSHLWRINEVFSNADGTIQFIEMKECCGAANEVFIGNKWVRSDTTFNQFTFAGNLPGGSTANKHLLLGTAGFAALPGAPTPDYIIPDNFFALGADTIRYWTYTNSPLTFSAAELPLDGVQSLNDAGLPANNTFAAQNSPTNFADQGGSVVAPPCTLPGDLDMNGEVDAQDLANLLGAWGPCAGDCPADLSGNFNVEASDLAMLLGNWGTCP